MAESGVEDQQQQQMNEERLKYLDFVHLAAIQALMCCARLYVLAKENSGPLKPGVQTVEGTVKAVVGPVSEKFHGVPYELLKFVDRKVGDSMNELEQHVPAPVRNASTKAYDIANKVPEVARSMAGMAGAVQRSGVLDTATGLAKVAVAKCEPTAKELYSKYEPVAEHYAVAGWRSLNKLPLFAQVAQIVLPTAAHFSEKYNDTVSMGREKGYAVASYLPAVPIEKIAKVFGSPDAADRVIAVQ